MAVYITKGRANALSGSYTKNVDVAPDGTLYMIIVDGHHILTFRSTNAGASWKPIYDDFDISREHRDQQGARASLFIDKDGYAHCTWTTWYECPQLVRYARGRPRHGGGFSWRIINVSPGWESVGYSSDVVAFRRGTGWVAWVSYSIKNQGARVAKIDISSSGSLSVASTYHGPPAPGGVTHQIGALEFAHTGDGKTPSVNPHVFLVTMSRYSTVPVRGYRAKYESGNWTWENPVSIDATNVKSSYTAMVAVYDGSRLCVAWSPDSNAIRFAEWNPDTVVVTRRDLPSLAGFSGNWRGISAAMDPVTQDIFLAGYGQELTSIYHCALTRATNSWGTWSAAVSRAGANSGEGMIHLVRYPQKTIVDMIYAEWSSSWWQPWKIFYHQLRVLVRTPPKPVLVAPLSGHRSDLTLGATFQWTYNKIGPGDLQQAWQFRRVSGVQTQYWNHASQAWGSSDVWNTGTHQELSFGPGYWTSGATYVWSVRARSTSGGNSDWAVERVVIVTDNPVVVATEPSGMTYGESTPLVEWSYLDVDPQASYEVRIVASGQVINDNDPGPVLWTSGRVTSTIARSSRVAEPLSDGVGYRAYVRAVDDTDMWSAWSYTDFILSTSPPAGPLVEVFDEIGWDSGVPATRLNLLARSNYLSNEQAVGQDGWEADANATLAVQDEDAVLGLQPGLKLTSQAAGIVAARTMTGTPPEVPVGEVQPTGPLHFAAIAGYAYTATAEFHSAAVTRAARVAIRWYMVDDVDDPTVGLISETIGEQIATPVDGYLVASLTAEAPFGAVRARLVVQILGATAAGEEHHISRMSLQPGRSTAWQSGGYAVRQTLRIERSDDDGVTWVVVATRVKPDVYQRAVERDRLMPFGTDVKYRAFTDVDIENGAVLSSGSSPVATIIHESTAWVLRDPDDDDGEMIAYVTGRKRKDKDAAVVHWPVGRHYPVVDSEGVQAEEGSIDLWVPASTTPLAMDLLRRGVPLVLQSPIGLVLRVRPLARDYPESRKITFDYVEVD